MANVSDDDQFKHGVHISHWEDVAPKVGKPLHVLEESDIKHTRHLNMTAIRTVAVDLGPYHIGTCNCHHTAKEVYNYCEAINATQQHIPNSIATWSADMLAAAGVDVSNLESRSTQSNSESTSHSPSSQYKKSSFPIDCAEGAKISNPWLILAVQLSAWIYQPVKAPDIVGFKNELDHELVGYIEESDKEIRLAPGGLNEVSVKSATITVRFNKVGLLGYTSYRTRLAKVTLRAGERYSIKPGLHGKRLSYLPHAPLPSGSSVEHLDLVGNTSLVQWALVSTDDTLYFTFKGTTELLDIAIDLGAVSYDAAPHGIAVHGSMWNALHQRNQPVIERIMLDITKFGHNVSKSIVLCGHSLGGGYAILAASAMLYRGVNVNAVLTFGAPQVVVLETNNPVWRKLNDITSLFVNAYDLVPRMPSCSTWLFDVLPTSGIIGKSFGAFSVSYDLNGATLQTWIRRQSAILGQYDIFGTLVFMSQGTQCVKSVPHCENASHQLVLEAVPDDVGEFIVTQHSMDNYVPLIMQVVAHASGQ